MSLTPQQLIDRRDWIGASQVAGIIGMSPWSNAYSIFLEKTGQLEPQKENESMKFGNRYEAALLDDAEDRWGKLVRQVSVYQENFPILRSTLDGRIVATSEPVEVKTCGRNSPYAKAWGEEGSSEIPDSYYLQCQVQIRCTAAQLCRMLAMVCGDVMEFSIEPDPQWQKTIGDVCEDFWTNFVTPKIDPRATWWDRLRTKHGIVNAPDPCVPNLDVTKRIKRVPQKYAQIDVVTVASWEAARDARLEAEKIEKQAQAKLLAELGDAEGALLDDGRELTYFEQRGASIIDRDGLEAAGLLSKYSRENRYRVARIRKVK